MLYILQYSNYNQKRQSKRQFKLIDQIGFDRYFVTIDQFKFKLTSCYLSFGTNNKL